MREEYYKKLQNEINGEKKKTANGSPKKKSNTKKMLTEEKLSTTRAAIR